MMIQPEKLHRHKDLSSIPGTHMVQAWSPGVEEMEMRGCLGHVGQPSKAKRRVPGSGQITLKNKKKKRWSRIQEALNTEFWPL